MKRTARNNAREFGRISHQGYGVYLGLLVACSVDTPGKGQKARLGFLTVDEFATEAEVSRSTVQRYLDKWDRMVAAGWLNCDRANLTPDDVDDLVLTAEFVEEFGALATLGRGGMLGKVADIAANTKAMAAAIEADPAVAEAALKAVTRSKHRNVAGVSSINRSPETADGKASKAKIAATNSASATIALPIFNAAADLQRVQRSWEIEAPHLSPGEQRQVDRSLTDIIVAAESLRLALGLDRETGRTR